MTKLLRGGVTYERDFIVDGVEMSESITRPPILEEVMLDPDFLVEMKQGNEQL